MALKVHTHARWQLRGRGFIDSLVVDSNPYEGGPKLLVRCCIRAQLLRVFGCVIGLLLQCCVVMMVTVMVVARVVQWWCIAYHVHSSIGEDVLGSP